MLGRRASILAPLRDSKDTKKILENKVFLRLFLYILRIAPQKVVVISSSTTRMKSACP